MKLLAFLVFFLTACTSYASPYAMRAAADGQIQATRAAANQAKAAQVEQGRATEAAAMSTQGAAQIEIDRMNAAANATTTAISNDQAQLDAALLAGQATRVADEYSVITTQTAQSGQATATALAIEMSYQAATAARAQETALFWSGLLPNIARLIIIFLTVVLIILVVWIISIARVDAKNRANQADWLKKKRSFIGAGGAWFYVNDEGEPIQVNFLRRDWQRMNGGDQETDSENLADNYAEMETETKIIGEGDPLRIEAIKLTSDVVTRYGDDYLDLPGWREMEWTSSRWQKGRAYLQALGLIRQEGQRWQFVTGAREVLHRLNLPHPAETSN